jgi:hypothetical protein
LNPHDEIIWAIDIHNYQKAKCWWTYQ